MIGQYILASAPVLTVARYYMAKACNLMELAGTLTNRRALTCLVSRCVCVCVCVFLRGFDGAKHILNILLNATPTCLLSRRASQDYIEPMPVYFKVLDKHSEIVVGPTANVLNVVAAEADRGCPAPPLPRQLLRVHADGLRLALEN
jgi:hypothetical protein